MFFDWILAPFRHARRRELLDAPFPADWLTILEQLPFYRHLDERGQQRLGDDLRVLIAEKNWEGCGGLELTDEIQVTIAAQASLLLLNIEHEYFSNVTAILVYPSTYRTMPQRDQAGVLRPGHANLGEAWQRGPVILAWDSAQHGALDPKDGHNLVLHEFAHKLDMLDDLADGTPPMPTDQRMKAWIGTMSKEYSALKKACGTGRPKVLDCYGATNPAEFFAVATECFFEKARQMKARHPGLYAVLQDYYQQDPAR